MSATKDIVIDRMNAEKVCEVCRGKGYTMRETEDIYGSGDVTEYKSICQCVVDILQEEEMAYQWRNK